MKKFMMFCMYFAIELFLPVDSSLNCSYTAIKITCTLFNFNWYLLKISSFPLIETFKTFKTCFNVHVFLKLVFLPT